MRFTLILLTLFLFARALAQQGTVENYRKLGYQAKLSGKTDSSIYYYSRILGMNARDYDANLALARLFFSIKDYEKSGYYYQQIYSSDSNDAEALAGLARIAIRQGEFIKAGYLLDKMLKPEPPYIEYYFDRARTLIYQDKLDSAVLIYQAILEIDNTYAEAWAGAGKMFYWQNQPKTALKYYQKAIQLDPMNTDYQELIQNLEKELAWQFSYSLRSIIEEEESYKINALVNSLVVANRVSDKLLLGMSLLYDHSDKALEWQPEDTLRTFSNIRLYGSWLGEKNRLHAFAGFSPSDGILSSYGMYYSDVWKIGKKMKISSTTAVAYDYFYYWNKVGQDYLSENLMLGFEKLSLNAYLKYGIIRKNRIADFEKQKYDEDINPYFNWHLSARYKIFSKPTLNIGLTYSFLDYTYKSPLYYSPKNRSLAGLNIGFYQAYKKLYLYLGGGYNIGRETYYEASAINPDKVVSRILKVDNWSLEFETGYQWKNLGIAFGGSLFDNPYYKNRIGYLSINYLLQ